MNSNNSIKDPDILEIMVSTYPRPNEACRLCGEEDMQPGRIRVLNAASGYNAFVVFIGECLFSSELGFGELSGYEKIAAGAHMITLMGENGYIYLQKPFQIGKDEDVTIAVLNAETGIDIEVITDGGCEKSADMACIRAVNLSYNSGTLSVIIGSQFVTFNGLRYRSVSAFKPVWGGYYTYSVVQSVAARFPGIGNTVLFASYLNLRNDKRYTIYLFNWKRDAADGLRVMIVEET